MIFAVGMGLLVVVLVIAFAARLLRRPARDAVAVAPPVVLREEIATMPVDDVPPPLELPEAELPQPALPEPEPEPAITWTAALTETSLDEAARLRLIDDLTLLAAPWAIAILRRAHREESSPELRARIETALASSGETVSATI
jgi:hypothetical protein